MSENDIINLDKLAYLANPDCIKVLRTYWNRIRQNYSPQDLSLERRRVQRLLVDQWFDVCEHILLESTPYGKEPDTIVNGRWIR